MAWLKYYEEERERQAEAHAATCDPTEAEIALRKMFRHFKVPLALIEFTSGSRTSNASRYHIVLNRDRLTWLLVCHEFAHTWDHHRLGGRMNAKRWHGKRHARLVDRAVRYCDRQGWIAGRIREKLEVKEARAAERERIAAMPPSTEQRIAHKEALIKDLERRAGRLETYIKRHRRSIAALRRAAARKS